MNQLIISKMVALEARNKELTGFLDGTEEPPPLLHPNLAKYYHEEIAALPDQLGNEETRAQAADKLRTLVSCIELVPDGEELVIVLRGDLASDRSGSQKRKKPHEGALLGSQGSFGCGGRI